MINRSAVQNNETEEILNIYRPYLANIKSNIEQAVQRGKYFDPAYYLEYFQAYNNILTRLCEYNPSLFSVLPKRILPVPSKKTDFDGRGYLIRSPFNKLIEDISLAIILIDNNYKNRETSLDEKKEPFFEKWWFQMFIAPICVALVTGIILMVVQKHYNSGDMAGSNIVKTNTIQSIEKKRSATKVNQTGNIVGGDIAGGNIVKED